MKTATTLDQWLTRWILSFVAVALVIATTGAGAESPEDPASPLPLPGSVGP